MKRAKQPPLERKLSRSTLYLDDLELIINTIEEYNFEAKIEDRDYEYDSLAELVQVNPHGLKYLEITAKRSNRSMEYVKVTIKNRSIFLDEGFVSSAECRALINELVNRLNKPKSLSEYLPLITLILAIFFFVFSFLVRNSPTNPNDVLGSRLGFVSTGLIITALILTIHYYMSKSIITSYRLMTQTFLEKNSEKILVATITATITAIITVVLTLVVTRFLE